MIFSIQTNNTSYEKSSSKFRITYGDLPFYISSSVAMASRFKLSQKSKCYHPALRDSWVVIKTVFISGLFVSGKLRTKCIECLNFFHLDMLTWVGGYCDDYWYRSNTVCTKLLSKPVCKSNGNIFRAYSSSLVLVNSPHKGQWGGALMFSLICAWTKRLST